MENQIKKRKSGLEKAVRRWVVLNVTGNGSAYGVVKEVDGREVTFNPHRALRYDKGKDCNLYEFVNEDSYLEVSPNGYSIEPTNKETLDYFTQKQNEEILKNKEKEGY